MASRSKTMLSNEGRKMPFHELLEDITINDEEWRCIVTMLVETTKSQTKLTPLLDEACETGSRKAVRSINRSKLFNKFQKPRLEGRTDEENSKLESASAPLTSSQKIEEHARGILQSQEEPDGPLPPYFEAALVKWMVYEAKLEQQRKLALEYEVKADQERQFLAMEGRDAEAELPTKGVGLSTTGAKPEVKISSDPRPNSRLRKRDEEWKDKIYIDDAPLNGPNLYILLTGFRDPKLPLELITLGVPLNCILKLTETRDKKSRYGPKTNADSNPSSGISKLPAPASDELDFWKGFDASTCLNMAIRSYCPSFLEKSLNDVYDNICYVLYDFHDTMLDHVSYLDSMKIYEVYDPVYGAVVMSSYEDYLKPKSEEYILIPDVMEALLLQVEDSLREEYESEEYFKGSSKEEREADGYDKEDEPIGFASSKQQEVLVPEASRSGSEESLSKAAEEALARLKEKLRLLNERYEVIVPDEDEPPAPEFYPDPEVIPRGDQLRLNECRARNKAQRDTVDVRGCRGPGTSTFPESRSFEVSKPIGNPRINEPWYKINPDEMKNCKEHLNGIYSLCERKGLDREQIKHVLNIIGLMKLLSPNPSAKNRKKTEVCPVIFFDESGQIGMKCNKSGSRQENNIASKKGEEMHVCWLKSREEAKTKKNKGTLSNMQQLRQMNASQSISSGSSKCSLKSSAFSISLSFEEKTPEANELLESFENCPDLFGLIDVQENLGLTSAGGPRLPSPVEEFEVAELLSPDAFLQILANCFQEFECGEFVAKHFLPSDSILLLFRDKPRKSGEVIEESVTSVIRTAVCLRDFCDYVEEEEKDWLENRRKCRASNNILDRYCSSLNKESEDAVENSIIFRDEDFILSTSLKAMDLKLLRERQNEENSGIGRSSNTLAKNDDPRINGTRKGASISRGKDATRVQEVLSAVGTEDLSTELGSVTYDFIGYDLGGHRRIQATNLSWSFVATDGLYLRLARDTWLLGTNKDQSTTSVRITVPEDPGEGLWYYEDGSTGMFHVITSSGIIVAFSKISRDPDNVPDSSRANHLLYEIQMSWPSGLIIKPMEYETDNFPPYVLQYYSVKGLEPEANTLNKKESHRKYLPNGDIVKFFNDRSIVVLRPNGTVITSIPCRHGEEESMSAMSRESLPSQRGGSLLSVHQSEYEGEDTGPPPVCYSVLEPDGREYELCDGSIVDRSNRLRTSIAEAYSVEEKFVRREDGTDMLIRSDGEMLVSFPDGTRTLYGCRFEDELACCDWSEEELRRYFDREEPEGFVSVVTYSRAEHPNYASVSRGSPSLGDCVLDMGNEGPRLRLLPQGSAQLFTNNKIQLELNESDVTLTRYACHECRGSTSSATFHLGPGDPELLLSFEDSTSSLTAERDQAGFSKTESCTLISCMCQQKSICTRKPNLRIFSADRAGQAYEYCRRSEYQDYEAKISGDERSSLVSALDYCLGLEVPTPILGDTRDCRLDYRITEAAPSAIYRISSDPVWDEPLKCTKVQPLQLFTARLFRDIVGPGPSRQPFKIVQKALLQYWQKIATGGDKAKADSSAEDAERCECDTDTLRLFKSIASGKTKAIDWRIYESGRRELKERKSKRVEDETREIIDRSYCSR